MTLLWVIGAPTYTLGLRMKHSPLATYISAKRYFQLCNALRKERGTEVVAEDWLPKERLEHAARDRNT